MEKNKVQASAVLEIVPDEAIIEFAQSYLNHQAELEKREVLANRLRVDDQFFETYFEQHKLGKNSSIGPVVRLETYKNRPLLPAQHMYPLWCGVDPVLPRDDPRSAVYMRGSRWVMQSRFERKTSVTEDIVDRYLRFIKHTALDYDSHTKIIYPLYRRLYERGYYTKLISRNRYKFPEEYDARGDFGAFWLLGEWITSHNNAERYREILATVSKRQAQEHDRAERDAKYESARLEQDMRRAEKHREDQLKCKADSEASKRQRRELKIQQRAAYEILMEIKNENSTA